MIISLKKYIKELKLGEVNYFSSKQQEQGNVEELYQKGCKLYDDDKYEEAIKLLDAALLINPKHFSSLYIKADSLKMLGNYKDAIIWADKALSIDSKHIYSLNTKAESLKYLGITKRQLYGQIKLCLLIQNISIHYSQEVYKSNKDLLAESLKQLTQAGLSFSLTNIYQNTILNVRNSTAEIFCGLPFFLRLMKINKFTKGKQI
ncbi:unnamed protein product [Paramecium pentaurelia]|uniref:Tetratricopeptide repeat protein n=1 Tax=Paramecium pentaurelia TaxID=43138 RepID=A0A8S1Y319_9CILI|nr:unnamed protein product [Paramecium pentaurelia]